MKGYAYQKISFDARKPAKTMRYNYALMQRLYLLLFLLACVLQEVSAHHLFI